MMQFHAYIRHMTQRLKLRQFVYGLIAVAILFTILCITYAWHWQSSQVDTPVTTQVTESGKTPQVETHRDKGVDSHSGTPIASLPNRAHSTDTQTSTKWALVSRSPSWLQSAREMSQSASFDEWAMAGTLYRLCATIERPGDAEAFGGVGFDAYFAQTTWGRQRLPQIQDMFKRASERCEGLADTDVNPFAKTITHRAALGASPLAIVMMTKRSQLANGLDESQSQALRRVLSDENLRGAWVSMNPQETLSDALKAGFFRGLSDKDAATAFYAALCSSGIPCESGSVLSIRQCLRLSFPCPVDQASSDIWIDVNSEQRTKLEAASLKYSSALSRADARELGFVR